jgi:lipopolysaccharide transport system ATP-binding protein
MTPAVRIAELGKRYAISRGQSRRGYKTLRESLMECAAAPLRRFRGGGQKQESFWALKNITADLPAGEAVGIIGRNGAGKSTLLKVLSRITKPTEGRVEVQGRVGSLLEVGTGFHQELTGRENIYLNGSILGMSKREIDRHFDDIVDFAEIDQFLDTPVKRYSSGMYVRLAFAVAAHLQPEILIVDEVLAVGDAAFQQKCLGKMRNVAGNGRTVLFVSHSMQAIAQLTTQVIMLEHGRVVFHGPTAEGIAHYTSQVFGEQNLGKDYIAPAAARGPHLAACRVLTSDAGGEHICGSPLTLEFDIRLDERRCGVCFSAQVLDDTARPVCYFWLLDRASDFARGPGTYRVRCEVPRFRLYMGRYSITTYIADARTKEPLQVLSDICPFEVTMRGIPRANYDWQPRAAVYLEDATWTPITKVQTC